MRKILIALIFIIPAQTTFCQNDSLLKNFKYRISNYRAIGFNIGGAGQFNQTEPAVSNNTNSNFSGNLGASYYSLKSTDRILLTISTGLSTYFNSNRNDNQNNIYRDKSFSLAPRFTALNKWFLKKMFTELGADISGYIYSNRQQPYNQPATQKNNQSQYSIAINTGIGKGRLENVTDMQNALWLNKALEAAQILSKPLNADELNELGQSITKSNNTRVLDNRKRIQFALETVDHYLQQKGLINKTDIAYFSNLNDILFFAFNNPRFAGTEKFIRFTPAVTGWNDNQGFSDAINKYQARAATKSLKLSSGLNKYIPTSLKHQNNYGASLQLCYTSSDVSEKYYNSGILTVENKGNSDWKKAAVNLFYQHAIYPNTRTTVSFNMQSELGYQDLDLQTSFYGSADLYANAAYFISYRTRLTCAAGAAYQKNSYRISNRYLELNSNRIQLYANAGVEISL